MNPSTLQTGSNEELTTFTNDKPRVLRDGIIDSQHLEAPVYLSTITPIVSTNELGEEVLEEDLAPPGRKFLEY
jgi:hypothetical protein